MLIARTAKAKIPGRLFEHDEATFGAGHLNCRIHHQSQEIVQDRDGAESSKSGKQHSNFSKPMNRQVNLRFGIGDAQKRLKEIPLMKNKVYSLRAAELNPVAIHQPGLFHSDAIQIRPLLAAQVAQQVLAILDQYFCMGT